MIKERFIELFFGKMCKKCRKRRAYGKKYCNVCTDEYREKEKWHRINEDEVPEWVITDGTSGISSISYGTKYYKGRTFEYKLEVTPNRKSLTYYKRKKLK